MEENNREVGFPLGIRGRKPKEVGKDNRIVGKVLDPSVEGHNLRKTSFLEITKEIRGT